MNIGNILNRRLGLITVPNLQKVVTNLLETIGFTNNALPDSRPYKVYTALLTQAGTAAPIPSVLENTLGDVSFTYLEVGNFEINSDGLFTENKTLVSISLWGDDDVSLRHGSVELGNSSHLVLKVLNEVRAPTNNIGQEDTKAVYIEIRVYN